MNEKLIAGFVLALAALSAHADEDVRDWAYRGKAGPGRWSQLSPDYEACGTGRAQSPVNIRKTEKAELPALDFQYSAVPATVVNDGHMIRVDLPEGNHLNVGEERYELVQINLHSPSEEQIDGKHKAMVAHFVHRNADGKLAVVAVLLQTGRHNDAFQPLFSNLPRSRKAEPVHGVEIDLAAMLPVRRTYYSYEGSLTSPPCTEGVGWMVMKATVPVSKQQKAEFRRWFPRNVRPVQPLNGRVVKESA